MMATINEIAPDFSLYSTEKELITLSSFKGHKVVLLFFPQAFTGTCTKEMCATRDDLSSYESMDAKILAISVDSAFTLAKYKEAEKLNFTLLSDFNRKVIPMYAGFYEKFAMEMQGVARRAEFVIDTTGVIRYSNISQVPSDFPDFDAIKNTLASIQ